jgi:DNA repair protein RadC
MYRCFVGYIRAEGGLHPPADRTITQRLKALALIDVRVLDHVVVSGTHCLSLAEQGLL